MGEDGGNGDTHASILAECSQMFKELKDNYKDIKRALWGGEGTTGIVKDINDIKAHDQMLRFLGTTVVGIGASVLTTVIIILFLGGKL